jgi:prephenate dehydrogenase
MAKPIITLIGLGTIGSSIGLALQRAAGNFEVVGHDKDGEATQRARRLNAVQRTDWNLHNACDGADMVVLAVPLSSLPELFTHIREDLKPETLILILVNVLQPALELAKTHLSGQRHIVVGHPILTGIGGLLMPRADLFDEATFCLSTSAETDPAAMQLATDLVERLAAKPLFVDAQEHDGLIAGVEQLPQLVAAAVTALNTTATGWREGQRLAGRQFAQATESGGSAQTLFAAWQANRTNLLLRIAQLQQELTDWQALLTGEPPDGQPHPLLARLEQVEEARLRWEGQALLKQWEDVPPPPSRAESRGMLQQMFLGGLLGKGKNRP